MLLLGLWLGAGLFMTWVATDNFDSVDRAMKPATKVAEQAVNDIGAERARVFLRYHSSEQNRFYFRQWGLVQLVLGVFLLVVVLFATNASKLMTSIAGAILAITGLQHFLVTPSIIELGRALDFANVDEMRDERRGFWNYHRAYSYMELAKFGMMLFAAGRLVVSSGERRKRRRRSNELDVVDNTENRHVNRRVRTAHRRHRGEPLRRDENEVADAGVDSVERD
jgi:hypothetical protein